MQAGSVIGIFVFSFVIAIGAVASPGPVSMAIISQSPRRGWIVGPLVSAGHAAIELVVVALIALGLSTVLARPDIQAVIGLVGGALLIWMGLDLALGAIQGKMRLLEAEPAARTLSRQQILLLGLVATVTNPFWYAWWVTVAPGYLFSAGSLSLAGVVAFYLGHISADFGWNTLLSSLFAAGRRWISDRVYRVIIGLCGAFLITIGISFGIHGIQILVDLIR